MNNSIALKVCFLLALASFGPVLGCSTTSLEKKTLFIESSPSVIGETIPLRIGIADFQDIRPVDEKEKTVRIDPLGQEFPNLFCKHLNSNHVFSDIRYPYLPNDVDLVMKGTIENFDCKEEPIIMGWVADILTIPFACQYQLQGGPLVTVSFQVDIEVSLENARTGEVITRYFASRSFHEIINMYSMLHFDARGLRANDCLRALSGEIIQKIFADRDTILERARPVAADLKARKS